jgi:hypothetical protein
MTACLPLHSGGNDRFCARLKTDISAFSSGLQGHLRSCLTISNSSRRLLSKNVRHDLVRPRRPELEAEMSVFNLAQIQSFPPLCITRLHCPDYKSTGLRPEDNKATGLRPDNLLHAYSPATWDLPGCSGKLSK